METTCSNVVADAQHLANSINDLNRRAEEQGIKAAPRPSLPFVDPVEMVFAIIDEFDKANPAPGDLQAWEDAKARTYARFQLENDKLAAEHKAKAEAEEAEHKARAAEARAGWERRDAVRAHAIKELEEAQRKLRETAAAADQAASQSATLSKLCDKDPAEG